MKEYIERDMLIGELDTVVQEYINEHTLSTNFAAAVVCELRDNVIADFPAADVVERKRGEWERFVDDKFVGYDKNGKLKYRKVYTYGCTNCGVGVAARTNFCPNCGADMRGENYAPENE